jgi:hypothetical protein
MVAGAQRGGLMSLAGVSPAMTLDYSQFRGSA